MALTLRRLWFGSVVISLMVIIGTGHAHAQDDRGGDSIERPGFVSIDCPTDELDGFRLECGMISVPADHAQPDGMMFQFGIVIVHSNHANPAPDPVLYVDGGAGSRTLDALPLYVKHLRPLLAARDLIFYDQRGAGTSQPALECPGLPDEPSTEDLAGCLEDLRAAGIDLSLFDSAQRAADVAAMRRALGYERWNLYGVSYGGRIALATLRDHPEGIRSVVLDSSVPLDSSVLLEHPSAADAAIRMLFERCQGDFLCRIAYPNLEQTYHQTLDQLTDAPIAVTYKSGPDGETSTLTLDGRQFGGVVSGMLGMPEAIASVPSLIAEVRAGNTEPLAKTLEMQAFLMPPISLGASMVMACNDDMPLMSAGDIEQLEERYPASSDAQSAMAQQGYDICLLAEVGSSTAVAEPAYSDIPVLLLTGQYDSWVAPETMRQTGDTLPNSKLVDFPHLGHAVLFGGDCPMTITDDFLDDLSATPATDCIDQMDRPLYVVSVEATRPLVHVLAGLALLAMVGAIAAFITGLVKSRRWGETAWRANLRRAGWLELVVSAAGIVAVIIVQHSDVSPWKIAVTPVEVIIPIILAIQAAVLFAPSNEPSLEIVLATRRPYIWIVVERLMVILALQFGLALLGIVANIFISGDTDVLLALARWIPPALFVAGVASIVTVRTREMGFGAIIGLLVWLVPLLGGQELLPASPLEHPFPPPLYLIQMLFWPIHPYFQPWFLTMPDYCLNRIVLTGAGCLLLGSALWQLRQEEWLLLGTRTSWLRETLVSLASTQNEAIDLNE
jgi:pimeloyl-ACP methyl ester carboxylesterase